MTTSEAPAVPDWCAFFDEDEYEQFRGSVDDAAGAFNRDGASPGPLPHLRNRLPGFIVLGSSIRTIVGGHTPCGGAFAKLRMRSTQEGLRSC